MGIWKLGFLGLLCATFLFTIDAVELRRNQPTERISGSAGDVLEDDPVGRLKVFVYELPSKYNKKILQKDPRCLTHMFAAEIFMHRFLLSSAVRTLNPEEADWFYTPVYTTCDLTPNGLPLPFKSPRMMRSAIQLISSNWPYWNRTEGADHFFVVPHDFGACFLPRREGNRKRDSSAAAACYFGSNIWTEESCVFERWLNNHSSICSTTENAYPPYS
uniref:Exostosin GT47 domain-containing protein n=1 Tax=Medicago truncatula TaxID=3880 RepID=I3SSC5_MEDTR|nr:unknown [Medicago truncatula]